MILSAAECKKKEYDWGFEDRDAIHEAIEGNSLELFLYLLLRGYQVYWGHLVRMTYLKRNTMLKYCKFEIKYWQWAQLILRILIESDNVKGYEILKPKITAEHLFWSKFSNECENSPLIVRARKDFRMEDCQFVEGRFELVSEVLKQGKFVPIRYSGSHPIVESVILQGDLESFKILAKDGKYGILLLMSWPYLPVEKNILNFVLDWSDSSLDSLFYEMLERGNIDALEHILATGLTPRQATIRDYVKMALVTKIERYRPTLDWLSKNGLRCE